MHIHHYPTYVVQANAMAEYLRRPPFDLAYKKGSGFSNPDKIFDVEAMRKGMKAAGKDFNSIARKHPQYTHTEITAPGVPGLSETPVPLALYQVPQTEGQKKWKDGRPVIYHTHGGG